RLEMFAAVDALSERVFDQAHAAELAHDIDAGARRLELVVGLRQIDAFFRGAEHELDGAYGTLDGAARVSDAMSGLDQRRDAADDANDVALGARLDARKRSDAQRGIDDGMERGWRRLPFLDGEPQLLRAGNAHLTSSKKQKRDRD